MRVAHDTARKVLFHLKAFCGFFDKTLTLFRSDTVDICHKIQIFNSPDAKKRIRVVGHKTELALGFERILLDIFPLISIVPSDGARMPVIILMLSFSRLRLGR